jgi:hypothetical protein
MRGRRVQGKPTGRLRTQSRTWQLPPAQKASGTAHVPGLRTQQKVVPSGLGRLLRNGCGAGGPSQVSLPGPRRTD